MAKIAVIIDDLFEDSEYTEPVRSFRENGHEITNIGLQAHQEVKGKKTGTRVAIDQSFDEADAGEFDALLIPGGYSPDRLRAHPKPVQFVKQFMIADKPVFCICHGAQILISAKALEGRKATCWKSLVEDIKYAGAEYFDKPVVKDGNLITSRQPDDIPLFNEACLEKLKEA